MHGYRWTRENMKNTRKPEYSITNKNQEHQNVTRMYKKEMLQFAYNIVLFNGDCQQKDSLKDDNFLSGFSSILKILLVLTAGH